MKRESAGVKSNPFRVVETNVKGFTNFYSDYHQKVLPTELVITSETRTIEPEDFAIMRFATAGLYRNPFKNDTAEICEWLDYTQLVAEYEKAGEEFSGTWSQEKLWFIEQWIDNGSDGHVEWVHASNVHVRIVSSVGHDDAHKILKTASGSQIQAWLAEAIRVYDEDRRMKNRENEPQAPHDDDHPDPYQNRL